MANIREIQTRINSVKDTMKITNAMYLISSTKMRQARKKLADAEPYFYKLQAEIARILRHMPEVSNQYFDSREEIPKEEMYKILENNISSIEVEEESEDYDGLYNVSEKTISLVNKNQGIGIEDIKKEQDIVETLAHEGIHALFRKNEDDTRN